MISELFKPEPGRWGLRGDPYLWEEMASTLADVPLPPTEGQFNELVEETFARLVGAPLDSREDSVWVERYSHGGMSTGQVSFAFWREIGIPLLCSRYDGTTKDGSRVAEI